MPFVPITDAASFRKVVTLGVTSENRFLDFKGRYGHTPDQAVEVARDVAQFANTEGGTLLVGVGEQPLAGRKVAHEIVAVPDVDGEKLWVEQAIRNYLSPATFPRAIHEIVLPEGNVLAINIPPSVHLVAHWQPNRRNGIEYLFRTDHGKQWLNPDEVETHIMNGSRAMQIKLERLVAELTKPHQYPDVEVMPPAEKFSGYMGNRPTFAVPRPLVRLAGRTEDEIELHVGNIVVRLPHGLIAEVWRTSDGKLVPRRRGFDRLRPKLRDFVGGNAEGDASGLSG
jgi:hypothetical protein